MMRRQQGRVGLMAAALVWLMATGANADVTIEQSASILVFPKVIADGTRDTIIQITNTSNSMVHAHCFYVDGAPIDPDDPLSPPRWLEIDFDIWLTKQQPTQWVVSEGRLVDAEDQRCQLFPTPITDCPGAGFDPGRVPPQGPSFTGELKCVEVDASGAPLPGNHLKGEATVITLATGDVAKYNGIGVLGLETNDADPVLCLGGDEPTDECPLGAEYNACPDTWILNHSVDGGEDIVLGAGSSVDTSLYVVPCEQNFESQVPESVVIQFDVIDEFESRFSASTTVTCWAELPLSDISNVFGPAPPLGIGPHTRNFVQTRMRPSRGTDSGFMVVACETHNPPTGSIAAPASAAMNLHIEGQRSGPDLITIPAGQVGQF